MIKIVLLVTIFGVACAAPSRRGPLGYNNFYGAAKYATDMNGVRQAHVNHIADAVGAGTGTARYFGVPGTNVGYDGHGISGVRGTHGLPGAHNNHAYDGHNVFRVNAVNAYRQHQVNRVAQHLGAGVGTAPQNGVPGTVLNSYTAGLVY